MIEATTEIKIFQNEFGSISSTRVSIVKIKKDFNINDITNIEITKKKVFLFYKRSFIRIVMSNKTHIDYSIKNNEIFKAERFVKAYKNIKMFNTDLQIKI